MLGPYAKSMSGWIRKKQFYSLPVHYFLITLSPTPSCPLLLVCIGWSVIAYCWQNFAGIEHIHDHREGDPHRTAPRPTSAGVHICSPTSGSSVSSPVLVTATSKVTGTIVSTQLWVDGVKKVSSSAASTLDASHHPGCLQRSLRRHRHQHRG